MGKPSKALKDTGKYTKAIVGVVLTHELNKKAVSPAGQQGKKPRVPSKGWKSDTRRRLPAPT